MLNNLFIFVVALFLVIKGSILSTRYATRLAGNYNISKYIVGFIIVAGISILPETLISVNSAFEGVSSFGLGVLLGSNVADLTLVFAMVIFLTGRNLKIESKVFKYHIIYPLILVLPLILGLNGHFSRLEGVALILAGCMFYYLTLKNNFISDTANEEKGKKISNIIYLLLSLAMLLTGSHFTVTSGTAIASQIGISPILIGMLVVGLGTTIPEFFFSLNAVKEKSDSLAVGDILGTVLSDATIVVGILALISPFYFPKKIIYITGVFMVVGAFILLKCMRSGRTLTRREAGFLFAFWLTFVAVEFMVSL